MAYEQFSNGETLAQIRAKINAGILEVEQASANALSRSNHTGTQAQSTITGLETALQTMTDGIAAIDALIGSEAGDGDTAVNKLREVLVILQNFSEGADVAQLITNIETDIDNLKPTAFTISTDTPVLTFDRRKSMALPYTPTGNFAPTLAASGNVDDVVIDFELVLDGTKTVTLPFTVKYLTNFGNDDGLTATLAAGTYHFYLVYLDGELSVSVQGPKLIPDTTDPTVVITSSESGTTSANPIPITITFNEAVTGFAVDDLVVANGSAGNFAGSGTTYTADITPTAEGAVTVDIAADVAIDAAGNGNEAATQFSITYAEAAAPTILFEDDFAGTTINTGKWVVTNPADGVTISQNNGLLYSSNPSSAVASSLANNVESIPSFSGEIVLRASLLVNSGNDCVSFLSLRDSTGKQIQISSIDSGAQLKLRIYNGTTFVYDQDGGATYEGSEKDVKIHYNAGVVKFYVWDGSAWDQMGTDQSITLDSTIKVLSGQNSKSPSVNPSTFSIKAVRVTDVDYSTNLPPV